MVTNLISFIDNDFFKLFFVLLSIAVLFVFIKNYFEKRKLEKRIFFSESTNDLYEDNFQHFNVHSKIEVHAENLNPNFELIAKLESISQGRFPKTAILKLENFIRIGQKSIRLSDRILGSLGNSRAFYVGILLANRHGSLSLIEHIEFSDALKSIANEFNLKLTIDEYADIVKKLKPLKSKISELDGKLVLTIKFNECPSKFAMHGFAEKFNLARYAENRFAKVNKIGSPEFTIVPADYVYDLNIIMDLPRVENPDKVFKTMYEIAEWLVFQFEGCIVDKNGSQLSMNSKSIISNQISNKIHLLNKFGLPPGGNLSMRVFN